MTKYIIVIDFEQPDGTESQSQECIPFEAATYSDAMETFKFHTEMYCEEMAWAMLEIVRD